MLALASYGCLFAQSSSVKTDDDSTQQPVTQQPAEAAMSGAESNSMRAWQGLQVEDVQFTGVNKAILEPLPAQLDLQPHTLLNTTKVRSSLRRLYATGLYKNIVVEGVRHGDTVVIIFNGTPALFLGRVLVTGVKDDRLSNILQQSTRLTPGTPYNDTKLSRADTALQQTLQDNGYYKGNIFKTTTIDDANSQVDINFQIAPGKQARVGNVNVTGDSGISLETFRKKGKLKQGSKVNRDTVSRALTGVRKQYQKNERLEATISLQSKQLQPPVNHVDYAFAANQGPVVKIVVNGTKLSSGKIRNLVPVYQEGSVDEDLLNEGNKRIRDYFQREGYFDVQVTHNHVESSNGPTVITYTVKLGARHRVESVTVSGNKYFNTDVLQPRLSVHKRSIFERFGVYSQALVQGDVDAIATLYQSNGFSKVKITPEVKDVDTPGRSKYAHISVRYAVDEGVQQRIGNYQITGLDKVKQEDLISMLSTVSGQPYSAANIVSDRDAILSYYLSRGFDHAQVAIQQKASSADANVIDVTMHITEGDQIFVNKVLVSGLHYTRPSTVQERIRIHPGDPLNQTALYDTQRQLYDLTLFNEVNTAVQNPNGDELRKNVLVQFKEAKRWDVTYGVGFQAQTGNPSNNCNRITLIQLGLNPNACNVNGQVGASGLVELNISRINLRGTDQSVSLKTAYGSLEKIATLTYTNPHIFKNPKLDFSLSGGYINARDVTTYAAERLEGNLRFTQRPNRANTFIYQFAYRRVKVDPSTVQVAPNEIPLLSEPVRIGGPEFTWIRDTRRPSSLDGQSGTYNSVQEFVTDNIFESEANFNRFDWTNSSYFPLRKKKYILARSTRFGFERAFGEAQYESIPLPERLYAGGGQSHRGFGLNSAGPRDSVTGFPIGGAGVFVNSTELRFPNPTLPYVGNSLGFVAFHDMGNVFNNSSDIWPSFLRIKQPHSETCKDLIYDNQIKISRSSSTNNTGTCDFNNFVHAIGLGLRYHTPIGPLRLDFSYNLNPPIYPVVLNYSSSCNNAGMIPSSTVLPCSYVGQAPHFNFFFSIGQAY